MMLLTLRQLVAGAGVLVSLTLVLAPFLAHSQDPNRQQYVASKLQLYLLLDACRRYKAAHGEYPSANEGLAALSPYLAGAPRRMLELDPWGGTLIYARTASVSEPEIRSLGADHRPGGEYFDADLSSRELGQRLPRTPSEARRSWVLRVVWAESGVALAACAAWLRELCRSGQGWLAVKSRPFAR